MAGASVYRFCPRYDRQHEFLIIKVTQRQIIVSTSLLRKYYKHCMRVI